LRRGGVGGGLLFDAIARACAFRCAASSFSFALIIASRIPCSSTSRMESELAHDRGERPNSSRTLGSASACNSSCVESVRDQLTAQCNGVSPFALVTLTSAPTHIINYRHNWMLLERTQFKEEFKHGCHPHRCCPMQAGSTILVFCIYICTVLYKSAVDMRLQRDHYVSTELQFDDCDSMQDATVSHYHYSLKKHHSDVANAKSVE